MFTPIEIIALTLIVFSAIKILVLIIKPTAWMNFAKSIYSNARITQWIILALAAVVFYYLIAELSVVQILAAGTFMVLLVWYGIASYGKLIIDKVQKDVKNGKIWKEYWFYTLLWVALMAWGLKEIFI